MVSGRNFNALVDQKADFYQVPHFFLNPVPQAVGVKLKQDKNEKGKKELTGSAVTEEGKRNPDGWQKPQYHPNIDAVVNEQYRNDSITVHAVKLPPLSFGNEDQSQEQ